MPDGAVEGQGRSARCLAATFSTWDSSAPLATLANWEQGSGSPSSGPWGEPFPGGGSTQQEGAPVGAQRKARCWEGPPGLLGMALRQGAGVQAVMRLPKASAGWGQAWGHFHLQGTS